MVQKVVITNRRSCCGDRLKSVEVRVGYDEATKSNQNLTSSANIICGTFPGPGTNGQRVVVDCTPAGIEGQFVTIQTLDTTIMNIAEVEVFGNII